jgi:hypothetical protein
MAMDVYFKEDIRNALRSAAKHADQYGPCYVRALEAVAEAFGLEDEGDECENLPVIRHREYVPHYWDGEKAIPIYRWNWGPWAERLTETDDETLE